MLECTEDSHNGRGVAVDLSIWVLVKEFRGTAYEFLNVTDFVCYDKLSFPACDKLYACD